MIRRKSARANQLSPAQEKSFREAAKITRLGYPKIANKVILASRELKINPYWAARAVEKYRLHNLSKIELVGRLKNIKKEHEKELAALRKKGFLRDAKF